MNHEIHRISQAKGGNEAQLLSLVDPYEASGWDSVVGTVTKQLLTDPKWLLDGQIQPQYRTEFIQELLEAVGSGKLERLDHLHRFHADTPSQMAFVLRFMEIFSEGYGYPYVWRGGCLNDIRDGLRGTFTFSLLSAQGFVMKNFHNAPRTNPCLIRLPVKSIVKYYLAKKGDWHYFAEHGFDGIFSPSFDMYFPDAPEEVTFYLPD